MIIAVNMIPLQSLDRYGYAAFLHAVIQRIVQKNPGHRFILFTGRSDANLPAKDEAINIIAAGPKTSNRLLQKWWLEIKLPALLKKYQADLFVAPDGRCSLSAKLPQCLLLPDAACLQTVQDSKKNAARYLRKANTVIVFSDETRKEILAGYSLPAEKIRLLQAAAPEAYRPLSKETKQQVKNKYTDGREYFIYTGAISPAKELLHLLKAFSLFKKRQGSGMKLVLTGEAEKKDRSFFQRLATYKYRDDVLVTGLLPEAERANLLGAAYALAATGAYDGLGMAALEAARYEVPVITAPGLPLRGPLLGGLPLGGLPLRGLSQGGETGLPAEDDIAGKMMLLYKDESLRERLVQQGREVSGQHSLDGSAGQLWDHLIKTVQ